MFPTNSLLLLSSGTLLNALMIKTHDGSNENDNEDNDDGGKCHSFLLCSKHLACFCLFPLPLHAMKSFTISI